ncbi:MAG: cadherin-like domain-containing protein, partial [Planctomycetota bacterium]|nr:cadherin-like domain-containing protein [Planctomycetota bacterium]
MLAAPVAAGDFFYVAKNSQLAVGAPGLLVNDFDADGDAITATAYSAATAGTVAGQSNGSFTYLPPNATYQGTATFTYRARDALTQSAQVTVAIDVGDVAGDTASNARTVTVAAGQKIELAGRIGDSTTGARDIDLFQLPLAAGQTIVADVDAKSLDRGGTLGNFDGYLRLFNSTTEVASNDNGVDPDTGVSSIDPVVRFTAVTSGTYYVGVSGTGNRNYSPTQPNSGMPSVTGDYRLQISVINNTRPDAVDDSIATTAGTKISIPVLIN